MDVYPLARRERRTLLLVSAQAQVQPGESRMIGHDRTRSDTIGSWSDPKCGIRLPPAPYPLASPACVALAWGECHLPLRPLPSQLVVPGKLGAAFAFARRCSSAMSLHRCCCPPFPWRRSLSLSLLGPARRACQVRGPVTCTEHTLLVAVLAALLPRGLALGASTRGGFTCLARSHSCRSGGRDCWRQRWW